VKEAAKVPSEVNGLANGVDGLKLS
jgi:hypothetical protein